MLQRTSEFSQRSARSSNVGGGGGVSSNWIDKGNYDADTNSPNLETPTAGVIKAGYGYTVSVAGTFFTEIMEVGDVLIARQDDPTLLSHWNRLQFNINGQVALIEAVGIIHVSTGNPNATDTRTGISKYSSNQPFKTIAGAVAVVSAGETIVIYSGTYSETVTPTIGGFNVRYMEGAVHTTPSAGAFWVINNKDAIRITGHAEFIGNGTQFTGSFNLDDSDDIYIEGRSYTVSAGFPVPIDAKLCKRVYVKLYEACKVGAGSVIATSRGSQLYIESPLFDGGKFEVIGDALGEDAYLYIKGKLVTAFSPYSSFTSGSSMAPYYMRLIHDGDLVCTASTGQTAIMGEPYMQLVLKNGRFEFFHNSSAFRINGLSVQIFNAQVVNKGTGNLLDFSDDFVPLAQSLPYFFSHSDFTVTGNGAYPIRFDNLVVGNQTYNTITAQYCNFIVPATSTVLHAIQLDELTSSIPIDINFCKTNAPRMLHVNQQLLSNVVNARNYPETTNPFIVERQNYLCFSENFDNLDGLLTPINQVGRWGNQTGLVTSLIANNAISPSGSKTAYTISSSTNGIMLRQKCASNFAVQNYTISGWCRRVSGDGNISFDIGDGGVPNPAITLVTGQWVFFSRILVGAVNDFLDFNMIGATGATVFDITEFQLNDGDSHFEYTRTLTDRIATKFTGRRLNQTKFNTIFQRQITQEIQSRTVTANNYTLTNADFGRTIELSNAVAFTITVPTSLRADFCCKIIQTGVGQGTYTASGTTLRPEDTGFLKTEKQHTASFISRATASETFNISGRLVP